MKTIKYIKFLSATLFILLACFCMFYAKSLLFNSLYAWFCTIIAVCIIYNKKIMQNFSVDFIFLCIFCLSLIIPTITINNNEISAQEQRRLATFPNLVENNKINYDFGQKFDNYINDRFFARDKIIFAYTNLVYRLSVYVYKNKHNLWVMKHTNHFIGPAIVPNFTTKRLKIIGENLQKFQTSLAQRNRKFYVVSYPFQATFFKDFNISYNQNKHQLPQQKRRYLSDDTFAKIMNDKYNITYIDVNPIFKEKQKEDFVFYKTDHHPTDFGFFVMYTRLMAEIQKDFPDIETHSLNDFNLSNNNFPWLSQGRIFKKHYIGAEYSVSGINDESVFDTPYTFFEYKKINDFEIKRRNKFFHYHKNPHGKYKLMLVGDSSTEGFVYFMNTSFSEVEQHRVNIKPNPFDVVYLEKIIDNFNPDAVVFLRNRNALPREFSIMYDNKEEETLKTKEKK